MLSRQHASLTAAILISGLLLASPAAGESGNLIIETASGALPFAVELADTPEERARGLMFRESLPADAGMLFVYPRDQLIGMWMKNTLIPLDMLFISDDGRILGIAERTVPLSLTTVSSEAPARAVLEINGGTADRAGIQPGDRIRHPAFGNAAE